MYNRTLGETTNCKGCRYWSEMIAKCDGGGPVKAYCLAAIGSTPMARKYTTGSQTCEAWASGEDGAIDEPGSDPSRYDEQEA